MARNDQQWRNFALGFAIAFAASLAVSMAMRRGIGPSLCISFAVGLFGLFLASFLTPNPRRKELQLAAELMAIDNAIASAITQAEYPSAVEHARRATKRVEETFGESHPQLVHCLLREAFLMDVTKAPGSEALRQRAMALSERLGPEHAATVAKSLQSLAGSARAAGKLAESAELWDRTLAAWARTKDAPIEEVRLAHEQLAALSGDLGQHDRAIQHWKDAIALLEKQGNAVWRDVDRGNLAWALLKAGRGEEAEAMAKQLVAEYEPDKDGLAQELEMLAAFVEKRGAWTESEQIRRRVVALFEKQNGPEHASVSRTLVDLAKTVVEAGRPGEAEELLRRALVIAEKNASEHPEAFYQRFLAERLTALAEFQSTRAPTEAAELRARADAANKSAESRAQSTG